MRQVLQSRAPVLEYVQYGCGLSAPDGWLNFDVSPRLRAERVPVLAPCLRVAGKVLYPMNVRYGDIVAGLPLEDASVCGAYASHVLEHMDRQSIEVALRNTFRMLRPQGTFRLVVPDLIWRASELLRGASVGEPDAADRFMCSSYLGEREPNKTLVARLRSVLGNSAHRWMYDYAGMARLLEQAGFVSIRRCRFGDADDAMFDLVEDEGRFYESGHEELAIEAKRPA